MYGWIGDGLEELRLHLYCDADFAGDRESMKSTTGVHMALQGPGSFYPLAGVSKKQTCQSHSTPEAEMVSAAHGMRNEAIPALGILQTMLKRPDMTFTLNEDNQAMIRVVESGKNPTMRHIGRTHGVSVAELHEQWKNGLYNIEYTESADQSADIYTKTFSDPTKWDAALKLIGVAKKDKLPELIKATSTRVLKSRSPQPAMPARGEESEGGYL